MTRRWDWRFLVAIFILAAILRIAVAGRSGLWADEIFSLAMATGHSLEHPAAAAQPKQGDFVEPDHAVPLEQGLSVERRHFPRGKRTRRRSHR